VRARTVDLAGNSIPLKTPTPQAFALPANGTVLLYTRFEPVAPPLVVLLQTPLAGGSPEQLVIRSHNSDPSLDTTVTPAVDERHIAPPRIAVKMAERHGMLEDAAGRLRGGKEMYDLIVSRDAFQLPVDSTGSPLAPSPTLTVGYFPDPISRGAAFRDLPNTPDNSNGRVASGQLSYETLPDVQSRPGSVTYIHFGNEWPERRAFRLAIVEGKAAPQWDDVHRVLTVYLPKAAVASIPLSCFLSPHDLVNMGVWGWLREYFEAMQLQALQNSTAGNDITSAGDFAALTTRSVLEGGHEMITPARTLTLVHALQQPLGLPDFKLLPVLHQVSGTIFPAPSVSSFAPITAWRSAGSHGAVIMGGLGINGSSTSKIDIQAQLQEITDDPSLPEPTRWRTGAHVETIELTSLDAGVLYTDPIESRALAVYVAQMDLLWFAAPTDNLAGMTAPSTVAAPLHRFDDTKHRWVHYHSIATSRFQEYFEDQSLDFTRTGASLLVDVPSSARPLAPDVSYVMPAFGWENQETTSVKSSVRFGNSLRVYLNRPWYSSGDNEMLGVICWPAASAPPNYATREKYKLFFSQWGNDPVWQQSGFLYDIPTTNNFPNGQAAAQLTIEEDSQLLVDVAGHPVAFDRERSQWYCDIDFYGSFAYTPFVRLALARYQPHSIQGVELSRIVLADFVQLSPTRSATVSIDTSDSRNARVYVGGLGPQGPQQNSITATVQERVPGIETDLGWGDADAGAVQVIEDAPAAVQPNAVLWSGSIVFKNVPRPGQFRIVIREFEILPIDPPIGATVAAAYGTRLVYAAILSYDYPTGSSAE
jgi:hypothetical protein